MRYVLSVEVKLVELPEPPESDPESPRDSDDSIARMGNTMAKAITTLAGPMMAVPYMLPSGFDFRKSVAVTVESFGGLAGIIGRYESITREIQLERV